MTMLLSSGEAEGEVKMEVVVDEVDSCTTLYLER